MTKKSLIKPAAIKKGSIPYLLLFVSMIFMIVIGAFLQEQIAFFNEEWWAWMNDKEFYASFAAYTLFFLTFLGLSARYFRVRFHVGFFLLFFSLWAFNLLGTLLLPDSFSYVLEVTGQSFSIDFPLSEKIRFAFAFAVSCSFFYCFFAVFPKVLPSSRSVDIVFYTTWIVLIVAVIFSLVREMDKYAAFFDLDKFIGMGSHIESFFMNRNTFGTFLFLGLLATMYLQCKRPSLINYLMIVLFFIELVFSMSKTSLMVGTVAIVIFSIYRFVVTVKAHPGKSIFMIVLFYGTLLTLFYVFQTKKLGEDNPIQIFYDNVSSALLSYSGGTIESRIEIFRVTLEMLDSPQKVWFGLGDTKLYFLLNGALYGTTEHLAYTHNGFLHQLGTGGLVRLLLYLVELGVFLYCLFDNAGKKVNRTTFASGLFFFAFFVHGVTETTSFLTADAKGITLLTLVFLPVLIDHEQSKREENVDFQNLVARQYQKRERKPLSPKLVGMALLAVFFPLVAMYFALCVPFSFLEIPQLKNPFLLSSLGGFLFFYPFGVSFFAYEGKKAKKAFEIVLFSFFGLAFLVLSFFLAFTSSPLVFTFWIIAGAAVVFLFFFGVISTHSYRIGFKNRLFLQGYLPHIALACASIAPIHWFSSFEGAALNRYELVVICLFFVGAYAFFYLGCPFSSYLLRPINVAWLNLEARWTRARRIHLLKREIFLSHYYVPFRSQEELDRLYQGI